MLIEQEAMINLLWMAYQQGFEDAGFILTELAKRTDEEKEIKEKIGSEAREKLQRGEKVNWEEFAMMLSDDKEDDSETQT